MEASVATNELKRFSIFSRLDDGLMEIVGKEAKVVALGPDNLVCKEETESNSMFLIAKGRVQVSKQGVPLASLGDGDYFGEMSLLEEKRRDATVATTEESILYEIARSTFDKLVQKSPTVLQDVVLTLDSRLRKHNALVVDQYVELKKQYLELEEKHRQLLQTEKLASIGTLTAGIAHEINNPLTVLKIFSETLKKKMQSQQLTDQVLEKSIGCISRSTDSIGKLVNSLKSYVRADIEKKQVFELNQSIAGVLDLVSHLYGKERIKIKTELANPGPRVLGNTGKLQQVLMNLLSNAKDSLEDRETKQITIRTKSEEGRAVLEIEDSGCGISKENLSKIFENFFTTKDVGKGTGLGMGIIRGIITEMNGEMSIHSEVGAGTRFSLVFQGQ